MARMRTAILSVSRIFPYAWMPNIMAIEQLAAEAFDADVYRLVPVGGAIRRELIDIDQGPPLRRWAANLGLSTFRLSPRPPRHAQYDLLMMFACDAYQTNRIQGLRHMRRLARTQVVTQAEIWHHDVDDHYFIRNSVPVLNEFDLVYTQLESSVGPLRERLKADVEFLPLTVDAPAYANRRGTRPVAVTSLGRRDPAQHRSIAKWADAGGRWYFFDATSPGRLGSFREHLDQLGQLLQRSAIWVANRARFDDDVRTMGEQEVGLRYYEGLVAGCAMLGDLPQKSPEFQRSFAGLPGMIQMGLGDEGMPEGVERMLSDEPFAREVAISHQARGLRRCDLAHQLRTIAEDAGAPVPDMITQRIRSLAEQAQRLEA